MNKTLLLALLPLPWLLTQCVDPMMYGPGGGPPGPGPGRGGYPPYGDPSQRLEMREQGNDLSRQAYERGLQDGREDAQERQSQNYNRHRSSFDRSTEMPYRDGYNQGHSQASSSLGAGGGYANPGGYGGPPPNTNTYIPPTPGGAAATRDAGYNQGYDYGLRDLTSGRTADAAAHVGRYDPRYRSSFERGYYDGYNSRSGQGGSAAPSSSGTPWYR